MNTEYERAQKTHTLCSPLTGRVVPIHEVEDEVFSQKILGDGVAVCPSVGELRAPQDGRIVQLFETGHALTMETEDGAELLLHMDTVRLGGEGFTPKVKEGDTVRCGDLLATFDLSAMVDKGYDMTTPMVLSNSDAWHTVVCAVGNVRAGAPLLRLRAKDGKERSE